MSSFFLPNWSPPDDPARPLPAEGRPWPRYDYDDDDGDDDNDDDDDHIPGGDGVDGCQLKSQAPHVHQVLVRGRCLDNIAI